MEWKDVPRRAYYEKYERVKVKTITDGMKCTACRATFTDLQSRSIFRK